MVAFSKAMAKQNNAKSGRRQAGAPSDTLSTGRLLLEGKAARDAPLLVSFHTKHIKLLEEVNEVT